MGGGRVPLSGRCRRAQARAESGEASLVGRKGAGRRPAGTPRARKGSPSEDRPAAAPVPGLSGPGKASASVLARAGRVAARRFGERAGAAAVGAPRVSARVARETSPLDRGQRQRRGRPDPGRPLWLLPGCFPFGGGLDRPTPGQGSSPPQPGPARAPAGSSEPALAGGWGRKGQASAGEKQPAVSHRRWPSGGWGARITTASARRSSRGSGAERGRVQPQSARSLPSAEQPCKRPRSVRSRKLFRGSGARRPRSASTPSLTLARFKGEGEGGRPSCWAILGWVFPPMLNRNKATPPLHPFRGGLGLCILQRRVFPTLPSSEARLAAFSRASSLVGAFGIASRIG